MSNHPRRRRPGGRVPPVLPDHPGMIGVMVSAELVTKHPDQARALRVHGDVVDKLGALYGWTSDEVASAKGWRPDDPVCTSSRAVPP